METTQNEKYWPDARVPGGAEWICSTSPLWDVYVIGGCILCVAEEPKERLIFSLEELPGAWDDVLPYLAARRAKQAKPETPEPTPPSTIASMSRHDLFAAEAMSGLVAAEIYQHDANWAAHVARDAFRLADEMVKRQAGVTEQAKPQPAPEPVKQPTIGEDIANAWGVCQFDAAAAIDKATLRRELWAFQIACVVAARKAAAPHAELEVARAIRAVPLTIAEREGRA